MAPHTVPVQEMSQGYNGAAEGKRVKFTLQTHRWALGSF